jgi:SOS-response transcriptional repressor LexA
MKKKSINQEKYNQTEIIKAIESWLKKNSYSPSFRDVAELTGISLGTIHAECRVLRSLKLIDYTDGVARTLRIK